MILRRPSKLPGISVFCVILLLAGCSALPTPSQTGTPGLPRVLVVETFITDMARQVAGDRLVVESLLPPDVAAHAYQAAPRDIIRVTRCDVLILNGGGIETFINTLLQNAGNHPLIITASAGLIPRREPGLSDPQGDPHFWLDPNNVITYVNNIRDGFIQVDPAGEQTYTENAAAYILQLQALDTWIKTQVDLVPAERRQLVTNHDSLGYFADRYGFKVVGAIIPSFSDESAPSARQLASLIDAVRSSQARAIFLEAGANSNLAEQLAGETQAVIVTDLFTEFLSGRDGPAPSYLEMMKYNVTRIVTALK